MTTEADELARIISQIDASRRRQVELAALPFAELMALAQEKWRISTIPPNKILFRSLTVVPDYPVKLAVLDRRPEALAWLVRHGVSDAINCDHDSAWEHVEALSESGEVFCVSCLYRRVATDAYAAGRSDGRRWTEYLITRATPDEARSEGLEKHYPLRAIRGAFGAGKAARS